MSDLTLYRSHIDEFDPTKNGGGITDEQIESGVLGSLMPNLRPRIAEIGGERWVKFFIKANIDIVDLGIDIAKPTTCPTEEVYLALGTDSDTQSDLDPNVRLYGCFEIVSIDADTKKVVADQDVSAFVKAGDTLSLYFDDPTRIGGAIVKSVNANEVTLKSFEGSFASAKYAASSLFIERLDAGDAQGVWIKEVVEPLTKPMEIPPNEFVLSFWYDGR